MAGRPSGADEAEPLRPALGEHDGQQSVLGRVPDQNIAELVSRVPRIVRHAALRVRKHRGRFMEADPVLPGVRARLDGIPFEIERHG